MCVSTLTYGEEPARGDACLHAFGAAGTAGRSLSPRVTHLTVLSSSAGWRRASALTEPLCSQSVRHTHSLCVYTIDIIHAA